METNLYWLTTSEHGACPGVWYTQCYSIGEHRFPPPRGYQLWLDPWWGLGLYAHFLSLMLGFCLAWVCASLCMLSQILWVLTHTCPVVSRKHCFPEVWLLQPFCLFHIDSWALRGWCDIDVPFRAEHCKFSHLLHIDLLWVSVLIAIHCRKKLTLIYNNISLGIVLSLRSFSRIIVIGFPLWPITYPDLDSWPHWECQVWVPSHWAGFKIQFKKWLLL